MKSRSSIRRSFVPRLEALGDRLVPTAMSFDASTHILTITGDGTDESVIINDNGSGANGNVAVQLGASATVSVNGTVQQILVEMNGGNDRVYYRLNENLVEEATRYVNVDLGSGNDRFETLLIRDLEADSYLGLFVDGGAGADVLSALKSDWNVDMDIARGAGLRVVFDGGDHGDTLSFGYKGEMDGRLDFLLHGEGGDDTVGADITLHPGSTGRVGQDTTIPGAASTAFVAGDEGDDVLTLILRNHGSATEFAKMFGGLGFDTGIRTANVETDSVFTRVVE